MALDRTKPFPEDSKFVKALIQHPKIKEAFEKANNDLREHPEHEYLSEEDFEATLAALR